jgi:hypothetical protein
MIDIHIGRKPYPIRGSASENSQARGDDFDGSQGGQRSLE